MKKIQLFLILNLIFSVFSLEFPLKFDFSEYYRKDFTPFDFSPYEKEESAVENTAVEENADSEDSAEKDLLDATAIIESLEGRDDRGISDVITTEDGAEETVYSDKNGNIRRLIHDGEQMTARKIVTGLDEEGKELEAIEILSVHNTRLKKRIFDEKSRLISTEIFTLGEKARDMKLISSRKYLYKAEETIPYQSSELISDKDGKNKKSVDITFNSKGFVILSDEKIIEDNGKTEKKLPCKLKETSYDEENRVVSETNTTWFYTDEEIEIGKNKEKQISKKFNEKVVKKYVYKYTDLSEKPDYSYYENDELRLERKYESEKVYIEKTFMDDGFSILAYFEDGIKLYEIVYFDDIEVRRKNFD